MRREKIISKRREKLKVKSQKYEENVRMKNMRIENDVRMCRYADEQIEMHLHVIY